MKMLSPHERSRIKPNPPNVFVARRNSRAVPQTGRLGIAPMRKTYD